MTIITDSGLKSAARRMLSNTQSVTRARFYQDQYASVSFIKSLDCIKLESWGVPQSSQHYQLIHDKLLEAIGIKKKICWRVHVLNDIRKAGVVLPEDLLHYRMIVIPAMEKLGVRRHAVIMPKSAFLRSMIDQSGSFRRMKIQHFDKIADAYQWLRGN